MKIVGWNTEQLARYYTGATTSALAGATGQKRDGPAKRKRKINHATFIVLPLSPTFQEDFAACTRR